jgi:hypothetical protein
MTTNHYTPTWLPTDIKLTVPDAPVIHLHITPIATPMLHTAFKEHASLTHIWAPPSQHFHARLNKLLEREESKTTHFPRKHNFTNAQTHTKFKTKRRQKYLKRKTPNLAKHTKFELKICPNGHLLWIKDDTLPKPKPCQQKSLSDKILLAAHTLDRIRKFSRLRYPLQSVGSTLSDGILSPAAPLLAEPHHKMCSQKQFLHSSEPATKSNRTKMGPNTRIEAIRDVQSDTLDSLKRLSKFTTAISTKKLYTMSFEEFNKHKAAQTYRADNTRYNGRPTNRPEAN